MLSRKQTQVISGARGPEAREASTRETFQSPLAATVPQEELRRRSKERTEQTQAQRSEEGWVVYQSRAAGLRIQLTAPARKYDPATGRVEEEKPRAAQFREGVFRVKESDVLPDGRTVVETLERKESFGVNRDFWRLEDRVQYEREATAAEFLKKVEGDAELRRLIFERLAPGADGFAPPASESADKAE